jgi:hypothetical protein
MKRRNLWLSRQRDGNYMLTFLKPNKYKVLGAAVQDFYIKPGEPIGIRHLCPGGVKTVFGVEIEIGEQVAVTLVGEPCAPSEA